MNFYSLFFDISLNFKIVIKNRNEPFEEINQIIKFSQIRVKFRSCTNPVILLDK